MTELDVDRLHEADSGEDTVDSGPALLEAGLQVDVLFVELTEPRQELPGLVGIPGEPSYQLLELAAPCLGFLDTARKLVQAVGGLRHRALQLLEGGELGAGRATPGTGHRTPP